MGNAPAVSRPGVERTRRARPLRIGLTGGLACGKSTVAGLFHGQGVPVLDADQACHAILAGDAEVRTAIRRRFGARLLEPGGGVSRTRLREHLCAAGDEELDWLEELLHRRIYRSLETAWKELSTVLPYCLWVVPLLLESNARFRVDRVLVVDCPVKLQRARAGRRPGLDAEWLERLIHRQSGRTERLAAAHEIIDNSGPQSALASQVHRLHRRYRNLTSPRPHAC